MAQQQDAALKVDICSQNEHRICLHGHFLFGTCCGHKCLNSMWNMWLKKKRLLWTLELPWASIKTTWRNKILEFSLEQSNWKQRWSKLWEPVFPLYPGSWSWYRIQMLQYCYNTWNITTQFVPDLRECALKGSNYFVPERHCQDLLHINPPLQHLCHLPFLWSLFHLFSSNQVHRLWGQDQVPLNPLNVAEKTEECWS